MYQFTQFFDKKEAIVKATTAGNGGREIVLRDDSGEEVALTFEKKQDRYVCEGSCRVSNPKLANAIRKAVSRFKGDAIVNRIYPAFTMKYVYKRGSVVQISEIASGKQKLVYEYKNTAAELERLFRRQHVEQEIFNVYIRIDELLDRRNRSDSENVHRSVDEQLARLAHKLFELEA